MSTSSSNIPLETTPPRLDKTPALVVGNVSLLHQKKYSVPEACKLCGMGETNLREMIRDGRIPVVRVTEKKMLLLESDLETFMQGSHVTISKDERKQPKGKLSPLPKHVEQSEFMRKVRAR